MILYRSASERLLAPVKIGARPPFPFWSHDRHTSPDRPRLPTRFPLPERHDHAFLLRDAPALHSAGRCAPARRKNSLRRMEAWFPPALNSLRQSAHTGTGQQRNRKPLTVLFCLHVCLSFSCLLLPISALPRRKSYWPLPGTFGRGVCRARRFLLLFAPADSIKLIQTERVAFSGVSSRAFSQCFQCPHIVFVQVETDDPPVPFLRRNHTVSLYPMSDCRSTSSMLCARMMRRCVMAPPGAVWSS